MRSCRVQLLGVCVLAVLLAGCRKEEAALTPPGTELKETAEPINIEAEPPKVITPEVKESVEVIESEETVEYVEQDISSLIKTETEIDTTLEDGQFMESVYDTPPSDTVAYVASDREKIIETRLVESIVDENDPKTYRIETKEIETTVVKEIPEEYTDASGHVRYRYKDGAWYKYKYSSGDITLSDANDEETALLILNLFNEYDGYKVLSIECEEMPDTGFGAQYAYHVLYQKEILCTEPPTDVEDLTVTGSREETVTEKTIVEEKLPVLLEVEVETGEYLYYGWQEFGGNRYYYDKDGEKVTGEQVIRGIRYRFDKDGVLVHSGGVSVSGRNGVIDWKKVKESGITFAMIRCGYRGASEGMLIEDAYFKINTEGARAEGLATYIFFDSQAVNEREAVEEASFLIKKAREHGITTPLVLRHGHAKDLRGRADSLSKEDRTVCVEAFGRTLRNAGYVPMLCMTKECLDSCLDSRALKDYNLWLLQHNPNVTYDGNYDLWQYTAQGVVDGISGYTGLNIYK